MRLVERGPFLSALGGWLNEVRAGNGRFVLVGGEAGVGKTALVSTFVGTLVSVRVLWGACDALFTPDPLGPLFDVADQAGGALLAAVVAARPRRELFGAFLEEVGHRRPTVVVVEDVHWADEATLDLLRFVARRVGRRPALVLVTYRDDELDPHHPLRMLLGAVADLDVVRRLTLPPLSEEGVRAVAAGTPLDAAELFRQTGGNPFFVTAVVAVGEPGVPESVRDAVLARAALLAPEARNLLDAASLIGARVELDVLAAAVAGQTEGLEGCVRGGMLRVEGEEAVFRHELARMTVEQGVARGRKLELHGRVLAALLAHGGRAEPARLAYHAELARDRAACLDYALAAAERAGALGAQREAAAQYERALRVADDHDERTLIDLRVRLAQAHYLTGDAERALELRRSALEGYRRLGDRLREGDQLRSTSVLLFVLGRADEGLAAAAEAVALLETLPSSRELALAYADRAAQGASAGADLLEALELVDRSVALAEELGDDETLAYALGAAGYVDSLAGQAPVRAERSLELSLALGLHDAACRSYMDLAVAAALRLDLPRADAWISAGLRLAGAHDLDAHLSYLLGWRAWSALEQGRFEEADELASSLLADPRSAAVARPVPLSVVGLLRARRGDADPWGPLDKALPLAGGFVELAARVARTEVALLGGDPTRCAREALAAPTERLPSWSAGLLLVWAHRAGALPLPERELPEPFAREVRGDHAGAASIWEGRGAVYQAVLARAFSGDEPLLRQAHSELLELGANAAARLVARRLRERGATGIPRGPRPATRANPAGLTTREVEVLRLLAAGFHNNEIAGRLYVSPRTVDSHVGRILSKLGVRTRVEAAAEAARLGLGQDP